MYLKSCLPLAGDTPYFVDKFPFNFNFAGAIGKAIPSARIVHVKRNALDTCFSNYKHLFRLGTARHSYDLQDLGRYHLAYRDLMAHWHLCLPGRIHTVDYDKLVLSPKAECEKLVRFLGLSWSESYLDFHKSNEAVATPSAAQVRKKIHKRSSGNWKNYAEHLQPLIHILDQEEANVD